MGFERTPEEIDAVADKIADLLDQDRSVSADDALYSELVSHPDEFAQLLQRITAKDELGKGADLMFKDFDGDGLPELTIVEWDWNEGSPYTRTDGKEIKNWTGKTADEILDTSRHTRNFKMEKKHFDDSRETRFSREDPEGRKSIREYKDGRVVTEYRDGREVTDLPENDPENRVRLTKLSDDPEDRRSITEYKDGRVVTKYWDGR
jgi:hypothetical protein